MEKCRRTRGSATSNTNDTTNIVFLYGIYVARIKTETGG
jgi:hypothetical protein